MKVDMVASLEILKKRQRSTNERKHNEGYKQKRGRALFGFRSELVSHWPVVAPNGGQDPSDLLMDSPAEHLYSATVRAESMPIWRGIFRGVKDLSTTLGVVGGGQSVHAFQHLSSPEPPTFQ